MKSQLACAVLLALVTPLFAQAQGNTRNELRESQLRLEQIRVDRQKLQEEMEGLRSRVRDASRELTNIERQRIVSTSALRELELQTEVLNTSVEDITNQRSQTERRLIEKEAAMSQRLRAIYKRGPLNDMRVLLGAESFGELLSRYKYLKLITMYEQRLVEEVSRLENALTAQEQELRENLSLLDILRDEKEKEVGRLREVERQRGQTLLQYRQREQTAQKSLDKLAQDEAALTNAIAALETRRRNEESRTGDRAATTLNTRDLGALNWPVEGDVVFRFGPQRKANGVVIPYHGIGIAAPVGTPVKAVESGTVASASALEGYGLSIVVSHGGGAYTLYMRLKQINVRPGQAITAGQVIGTTGGEGTEHGPHLEFQVRVPTNGVPVAVDPQNWLRARRNQ
jgi:septal ring factor EnvC (AmiA/AmiB activator)